ncbi:translocation/assembly module TamB domain-containing protein [Bacteroidota bacterium]
MDIHSIGQNSPGVRSHGIYKTRSGILDADVELTRIKVNYLEPYLSKYLKEINGEADVNIDISGTLRKPEINGYIALNEVTSLVPLFMTRYWVTDTVRIYRNDFYLDNIEVFDIYDHGMTVNGNITTENLRNVTLNLAVDASNVNFLSTTWIDNEQYYGDVFASGNATVTGRLNYLTIEGIARTERNTNIKLPLFKVGEIQSTDFLTFVDRDSKSEEIKNIEQEGRKNVIIVNLDLEVTSDAKVQLIFDPQVGDIIEANGYGKLNLKMNEEGELSVFGDVTVIDGEYLFTIQNVINKRFQVEPGGTITLNGKPEEAVINLRAIYQTKAAVSNLEPMLKEELKRRIPVNCLLSLQGELANPTITPQIELPTADAEIRSIVGRAIGTDEELMRQFISLLIINNFISTQGLQTGDNTGFAQSGGGVMASELLSSQLSNWMSQISNDFDIGVNYRPGFDTYNTDEIEVALSTQIFNDRIRLSGNLDVLGEEASDNASNIVGDFDIEFLLTDKISLNAFNRLNDDEKYYMYSDSDYTQGLGIRYRNEFNKLSDLFHRRREKRKKDSESGRKENTAIIRDENQDGSDDIP